MTCMVPSCHAPREYTIKRMKMMSSAPKAWPHFPHLCCHRMLRAYPTFLNTFSRVFTRNTNTAAMSRAGLVSNAHAVIIKHNKIRTSDYKIYCRFVWMNILPCLAPSPTKNKDILEIFVMVMFSQKKESTHSVPDFFTFWFKFPKMGII